MARKKTAQGDKRRNIGLGPNAQGKRKTQGVANEVMVARKKRQTEMPIADADEGSRYGVIVTKLGNFNYKVRCMGETELRMVHVSGAFQRRVRQVAELSKSKRQIEDERKNKHVNKEGGQLSVGSIVLVSIRDFGDGNTQSISGDLVYEYARKEIQYLRNEELIDETMLIGKDGDGDIHFGVVPEGEGDRNWRDEESEDDDDSNDSFESI